MRVACTRARFYFLKGVIMKRLNRRLKCFFLALLIAFDIPLMGYTSALAADAATYRTGLAPMEALVAAVVIGSGIVAGQSQQAVNALVNSVSKIIKDNTVRKAEEDPAFESPYRVIQGGGDSGFDPTPEEPNNNNKNGRWFGVVGASALGSSLLFEKGAVEEIMQTIKNQNGYNSTVSDIGIVSADDFKTQSTSGQIALQLANLGAPALGQFNAFLNSSYWNNSAFDKNNCWFAVLVDVSSLLQGNYPKMRITILEKSDDVKYLRLKNRLSYYTYTQDNQSISFYGIASGTSSNDNPAFLDEYEVNCPVKQQVVELQNRNSSGQLVYDAYSVMNSNLVNLINMNSASREAYCGYKWVHHNDWGFTNNIYNSNQTFNVNFPDWLQDSITLLGKQIDAVNLGLQNLSKINWAQTQQQIQTAAASDAAVSQAINNWENPGNIPEPEPQPQPDPEPEPEPDPGDEPAHEDAVNDSAESVYNWVTQKITLPAGIFEKIPFSIPYDLYLLLRSMFPTSSRVRKKAYLNVSNVQSRSGDSTVLDPNGITISSHFDAVAKNTRSYAIDWKPAPVINLDLHFSYSAVGGQKKTLDIVKTVDLQSYSYFAMIVYIFVYISWLGAVLGWILESFK